MLRYAQGQLMGSHMKYHFGKVCTSEILVKSYLFNIFVDNISSYRTGYDSPHIYVRKCQFRAFNMRRQDSERSLTNYTNAVNNGDWVWTDKTKVIFAQTNPKVPIFFTCGSHDVTLCGWLGSKYQLTKLLTVLLPSTVNSFCLVFFCQLVHSS